MSEHRAEFSIAAMCRVLRVSRSGYYAWLQRPSCSRWQRADADLVPQIRSIHQASRGVYGAPRIQAELRAQGTIAGRHRITRIMSEQGLQGVSRRRRKSMIKRSSAAISSQDLVQPQFRATSPNELWVADATYVPTAEGVLNLAIVFDVFARRIVGWSMADRNCTLVPSWDSNQKNLYTVSYDSFRQVGLYLGWQKTPVFQVSAFT